MMSMSDNMGKTTTVLSVLFALFAAGCEPSGSVGDEDPVGAGDQISEASGGAEGFFDEDLLMEGAEDLGGGVDCVGEETSRKLTGRVLAPDGRLAMMEESLWERLIP